MEGNFTHGEELMESTVCTPHHIFLNVQALMCECFLFVSPCLTLDMCALMWLGAQVKTLHQAFLSAAKFLSPLGT